MARRDGSRAGAVRDMTARFIAFLRGVNVGGRVVTKDVLHAAFVRAGLARVRTHIASGNVSFDASAAINRRGLTRRLETLLAEAAGYPIPVFLKAVEDVERALARDPFKGVRVTPATRPCIIFISEPLPATAELPFRSPKGDFELLSATGDAVYALMGVRNGRPGNPGAYLEKTFGVKATTRFLAATQKILAAATAD